MIPLTGKLLKLIQKAVDIIGRVKTDFCSFDYKLGGNTAVEFSDAINSKGHNMPIILLSGQDESMMDEQFLNQGVIDTIDRHKKYF